MKAICLPQPIAHLVAHGHIASISRFIGDIPVPERYFIYASERNDFCQEDLIIFDRDFKAQIVNAQTMGDLPKLEDLPTSAFIGYVDIIKCINPNQSNEGGNNVWSSASGFDNGLRELYFANAHFFSEKLVADIPFTESFEIPKESARVLQGLEYVAKKPIPFTRTGKTLCMSVNDKLFDNFSSLDNSEQAELELYITAENLSLLCKTFEAPNEANPLETETISLFHKGVPLEMKVEDIEFRDVEEPKHIRFTIKGMPKETFKAKIVFKLVPIVDSYFNRLEASTKAVLSSADKLGFSCLVEQRYNDDIIYLNNKVHFNYHGKDITCFIIVSPKSGFIRIISTDSVSMECYDTNSVLNAINLHNSSFFDNVWLTYDIKKYLLSANAVITFSNDIVDEDMVAQLLSKVFWKVYSVQKALWAELTYKNSNWLKK